VFLLFCVVPTFFFCVAPWLVAKGTEVGSECSFTCFFCVVPLRRHKTHEQLQLHLHRRVFVDAIEKWRDVVGLQSFSLLGHSLGGYVAALYASAHTRRVDTLLLLSPFGVERRFLDPERKRSLLFKVFATMIRGR
jgi:pimeloyl-ACP methyl ester carboxylesterase